MIAGANDANPKSRLADREMSMTGSKIYTMILGIFSVALLMASPAYGGTAIQGDHRQVASTEAAAETLNLDALSNRLSETRVIGLFTKLNLRHRFSTLLDDINRYHQDRGSQNQDRLKQRFNRIIHEVIVLLRNGDAALREDLVSSRDMIWHSINDPQKTN